MSHKGIAHCLDYEEELFHLLAEEMQPRLLEIQREAGRLRLAIHDEANKLRGYLYFDEIDNVKN